MITISRNGGPAAELVRRAARIGPGYRGRREPANPEQRDALRSEFAACGVSPPAYLDRASEWIERRAKLFETGDFPDKGVTITPRVLLDLERSFDLPVPVLIEHAESPLELGYLIEVEAEDGELFGTVALTSEANALVERSGARALSLGLNAELTEIREVSLVRNPRIADARLFFAGALEQGTDWRHRYEDLKVQQLQAAATQRVEGWIREGRLTPAQAPFAVALLQVEAGVQFDGSSQPVAHLVAGLLEARAPTPIFDERAPVPGDAAAALMLPEEADFYRRYFPGVSLDQIAAKR